MSGPVRSVSQAFAILRLLAGEGAMTLSHVCRETGLSPSSGLNLLRTLVAEGAVERDLTGKRYALAQGWNGADLLIGARIARLIARAQPLLDRFARTHDCTCGLWQQVGGDRLALAALGESGAETRIHMAIGQRQPVGGGSTGRALIAAETLAPGELERRFARLRWRRPLAYAAWVEQIARARQAGFGIDDGFAHPGVLSIGVALAVEQPPRLCLSASIFAGTRSDADVEALGQALHALGQDRLFATAAL